MRQSNDAVVSDPSIARLSRRPGESRAIVVSDRAHPHRESSAPCGLVGMTVLVHAEAAGFLPRREFRLGSGKSNGEELNGPGRGCRRTHCFRDYHIIVALCARRFVHCDAGANPAKLRMGTCPVIMINFLVRRWIGPGRKTPMEQVLLRWDGVSRPTAAAAWRMQVPSGNRPAGFYLGLAPALSSVNQDNFSGGRSWRNTPIQNPW